MPASRDTLPVSLARRHALHTWILALLLAAAPASLHAAAAGNATGAQSAAPQRQTNSTAASTAAPSPSKAPLRVVTAHRPPLVYLHKNSDGAMTYSGMLVDLLPRLLDMSGIDRPYELYEITSVSNPPNRFGCRRFFVTAGCAVWDKRTAFGSEQQALMKQQVATNHPPTVAPSCMRCASDCT